MTRIAEPPKGQQTNQFSQCYKPLHTLDNEYHRMKKATTLIRFESDQKIRERLLEIVSEYQLHFQAMQGLGTKIVNPFSSLGEVVQKYVNPLSLFLNDVRSKIERNRLTYLEALEKVAIFSRQTRFRDQAIAAVKELEQIEKDKPYFLYALQSLTNARGADKRAALLRECHRNLMRLNKKYQRKFSLDKKSDVIPWRIKFLQSKDRAIEGTYWRPTALQLNGFRGVIINLAHNLNAQARFFRFYHGPLRNAVRKDIVKIADILFDYGFSVGKIAPSTQASFDAVYIEELLNDYILNKLEKTASRIKSVKQISHHIYLISLLNLKNSIPTNDFCRITEYSNALKFARKIERVQKGKRVYRRIVTLYRKYDKNRHCAVLKHFLNFVFSRDHNLYPSAKSSLFGADFSKTFIFPSYFNAQHVQDKAQEEMTGYSSKGKDEMLALFNLLLNSLEHPQKYRNKEIVILGDIQSGAMGKVSIGIYRNNLVAMKKPASKPGSRDFSRLLRLLKYERRIHEELVDKESRGHRNIGECYGLVKTRNNIMLALGYFPADNLEDLIEKNRKLSARCERDSWKGLVVEELRRFTMQMADALMYMKNRSVIHRDLKPANVLFLSDQNGRLSNIKIIDFGIATTLDPAKKTDLFEDKTVGTLNYMAPEQLIGKEHFQSDVYSFGAIIYSLLTGRVPIKMEKMKNFKEKLRLVFRGERIPLFEANPALTAHPVLIELSGIVEKMLLLKPNQRPTIEQVYKKLQTLWSRFDDPETFHMPIQYAKYWGGTHQDSLIRTTTQTLDMDDVNVPLNI